MYDIGDIGKSALLFRILQKSQLVAINSGIMFSQLAFQIKKRANVVMI
jgi:hypothetical protein